MRKSFKPFTSIAVAAIFLSASPASAQQGEPGYTTRYFSDATHQTQVGTEYPVCTSQGVRYGRQGTVTIHSETDLIFYCHEGIAEPA